MIKVRRAGHKDIPAMVKFGKKFWDQTDYAKKHNLPYDAEYIGIMVDHLREKGVVQIALDDSRLVGIILMVVGPMPFSPTTKCATELAFFVDEHYRNQGVGKKLLSQAENVCKQLGVTLVTMVHLDSVSPEQAEAVYDQTGYQKNETLFTKDIR